MPASTASQAMANWRGMIGRVWRGLTSGRATITAGGGIGLLRVPFSIPRSVRTTCSLLGSSPIHTLSRNK